MGNLSNRQKKVLDEIIEGGLLADAVAYMDVNDDELLDAISCVYNRNYVDEDNLDLDEVCDKFSAEEMSEYLFEKHNYATYPSEEIEFCDAETLGLKLRNRYEDFLRETLYAYTGMGHFVPVQEMIDELKKQLA